MLIIYLKKLNDFGASHANARRSLAVWKSVVEKAQWKNKQDVLRAFPNAKMVQNNRARFEIVHNIFRLIAHIHYDDKIVEIRFIGTHNEYDRIDPATI
jgi:mRNA interferase HigB